MKVIFLDFDGPMNTNDNLIIRTRLATDLGINKGTDGYGDHFDERCCR